jgi:hypothetical protein
MMEGKARIRRGLIAIKWRLAFALTAALLNAVDLGLRRTSYRQVSLWLVRLSPLPQPTKADPRHARAIAYLVGKAAAHPRVAASCLRRSLVLWWLLRWWRLPSEIRFGVSLREGHAWVEHHGEVINDAPDVALRFPITYGESLAPENVATFVVN